MKTIRPLLIALLLTAVLSVAASASGAAPTQPGIFGINSQDGVLLAPAGEASVAVVDGQTVSDFYANAETLTLTYRAAKQNAYYSVYVLREPTVPTQENLVYFGSAAASGGEVVFERIYPTRFYSGSTYYVYVVGGGKRFEAAVPDASFRYYAPSLAGDVDGDGRVTALDASYALQLTKSASALNLSGGMTAVTDAMKHSADIDHDGLITAVDATLILQNAVAPNAR